MPNTFAYIMLLAWPLVMVAMFRRMSFERALIWSILGAYLFLPPDPFAQLKVPGVPALDKMSLPAVVAWLLVTQMLKRPVPIMPKGLAGRALLLLFIATPFATVVTNPESVPLIAGGALPGMVLYDALSIIAYQGFVILTFALARSLLASTEAMREILIALMIGGLIYSIPMLIEVRLSPQINIWVYGFFQHSFEQMVRQGGFRPIVFLAHGLWVAFFAMTAILAAAALAREAEGKERKRLIAVTAYLLVILVLCKSIGSLLYAVALLPVIWFAEPKWLIRISVMMGILALIYPVLRANGHIPADELVAYFAQYSADRAQSLEYRFQNEALLVEHAYLKPWFGWGGYGRNLLYHPETGRSYTVPDGRWVIVFGTYGWSGYLAEFGLLALPPMLLWRESMARNVKLAAPVGALALIHGINMIDMLPNATLTTLTWMIAGALLGHAEKLSGGYQEARGDDHETVPEPSPQKQRRTVI